MVDLRQRAELIYSQTPFVMIFVDHAGLVSSRKWVQSTTDRQNEVIRDAKKMALGFNRGEGIPVVVLFQINRQGFAQANKLKEKGGTPRYDLTSLSYANEAERSADVVTASWLDIDLSNRNRVQFQCLKSRDMKPFEIFWARVEWASRRLYTCYDAVVSTEQHEKIGKNLDESIKALDA